MAEIEIAPEMRTWTASDGYPILVASWRPAGEPKGRVVVLHGVQSHQGWYHGLGRRLAERGYEAHFPDRRGSGGNALERGHTPSANRLIADQAELLTSLGDDLPRALAGISWGGKIALLTAARHPDLAGAVALICPGLLPRVGVSLGEKLRIAWAFATNKRKPFPIPLNDPALFTADPEGRAFIAADPLGLREATASTLAASTILDVATSRVPPKVRQPVLLMLGSEDRIIDNARTRAFVDRLASPDKAVIEYQGAHHTLEFEPDPGLYARDLADWLDAHLVREGSPS